MPKQKIVMPDMPGMWEEISPQFEQKGTPGFVREQRTHWNGTRGYTISYLLFYDDDGELAGVFQHFNQDIPFHEKYLPRPHYVDSPLAERAGNVNLAVHPNKRRQGIGTRLLKEAIGIWNINFDSQIYTKFGLTLVESIGDGQIS